MSGQPISPPPSQLDIHNDSGGSNRMRSSGRSEGSFSSMRSLSHQQKTLNFFRKIMGQRDSDYRSDAPQTHRASSASNNQSGGPMRFMSARSMRSREASGNPVSMDGTEQAPRFWEKFVWPEEKRHYVLLSVIKSKFWRGFLFFFTIVLLFGAQFRDICIPLSGDVALDVLFMMAFCIFWIDIFIRIDVEPNYFNFNLSCRRKDSNTNTNWTACFNCQFGSFIFWCEVVSTVALLWDISFIAKRNFDERIYAIKLDRYGLPTNGLENVNSASPVEPEVDLLLTIAKTLRAARFIRSSTAVKISSKVNWYWFLNPFNPSWYWQRYQRRIGRLRASIVGADDADASSALSERGPPTGDLPRRSSWGHVGMGAMAAVRAKATTQDAEIETQRSWKGRFMRFLKIGRPDEEEIRHQLAATKIQRAWRKCAQRSHDEVEAGNDVAWRGGSSRNPEDTQVPKGSFIFSHMSTKHKSKATSSHLVPSRRPLGSKTSAKPRSGSQVGAAMRELTGQRVAIGIIVALVLTVLFSYSEIDATRPSTMIVLHSQTQFNEFADKSLEAARASSIPDLFRYEFANGTVEEFSVEGTDTDDLRARERLRIEVYDFANGTEGTDTDDLRASERRRIQVNGENDRKTVGLFSLKKEVRERGIVMLLSTIFILLVWFFGVTAFAGPVMILVVIPIERMVRLLGMLMHNPLGYQSTFQYRRFVDEEDEITKNTRWTKEVLKGMETSFLMSTILRIGSLMKVGFGSAGVEIIRKNLEKGQSKNMLILSSQGSTVSCIFLFCDIRQFTDATECLQEEVFVFTNRIAAVVHSICHSYGGSANKNVGDAFLLSWQLEEEPAPRNNGEYSSAQSGENFVAKSNQADKALLSVVKISIALHHDDYYIESMSDTAREALLAKLSRRKGPVVQMGFGLHAGKAVQGAIGSQRKIDATYVSEAVERAEFLESSTKKYGISMLMSDSFHRLLHPRNRRRCRKVDQIIFVDEDDESEDAYMSGQIVELLTFDIDIDALWKNTNNMKGAGQSSRSDTGHESETESVNEGRGSKREMLRMQQSIRQSSTGMLKARRRSVRLASGSEEFSDAGMLGAPGPSQGDLAGDDNGGPPELVLPTGPALYNANVWVSEDMRRIRERYSDGLFFQKFNSGLQSYYAKDWDHAKQCFDTILERFEDGPSRYFLSQIEKHNGKPPRDFRGYGTA